MKNIEIKIFKETRMVELNKFIIGNDGENLQGNLVFTFDEFVDGQARLEYVIDGNKNYIVLEKVGETYQVPILSVITKKGQIDMQVVVTQGTEDVAIFKSNLFYLTCNASINAEIEQPEEYMQWIEVANAKLNEVDNLDIDAIKENGVATITITKKDGTQQSVNLFDAEGAVTNYELLENLPSINGVELTGDKSLDELNIQEKGNYLTSETDPLFSKSASYGITSQDIQNWNNKSEFSGNYDDLNGKPTIPTKTSELKNDSGFISEIPSEYITEEELNNKKYLTSIPSEYVTETDYATREKAGLIRANLNTNTDVWQDYLYGVVNTYEQYQEKDRTAFVSKGTLDNVLEAKNYQDELVSGKNIKTINGNSILGSGNIEIQGGGSGITEIPIASKTTLGGIKVGANLTIEEDGTLNATASSGGGNGADDVPINTIVEYDGEEVPSGWEEVVDSNDVVLFESTSGTQNTITLNDSVANYEYIEIFYGNSTQSGNGSVKIHQPNGKGADLYTLATLNTDLYINTFRLSISGNTLTPVHFGSNIIQKSSYIIDSKTNLIYVYRVVGYK